MSKKVNNNLMWEVLVPTVRNDGRPINLGFHRIWDAKVRQIAGGLTVYPPVKGQWMSPDDKLYPERMIPVRIMCSKDSIMEIMEYTKSYYEQKAVLAYKISDECILLSDDDE